MLKNDKSSGLFSKRNSYIDKIITHDSHSSIMIRGLNEEHSFAKLLQTNESVSRIADDYSLSGLDDVMNTERLNVSVD